MNIDKKISLRLNQPTGNMVKEESIINNIKHAKSQYERGKTLATME